MWGGLCVAAVHGGGGLSRARYDARRLAPALWAGVAAFAAVVTAAQVWPIIQCSLRVTSM